MINIGIIGSRGDINLMNECLFYDMRHVARDIINSIKEVNNDEICLVSGGCSFADHIAVSLQNRGESRKLLLCLPCEFLVERNIFFGNKYAEILNRNHQTFSEICFLKESNESLCQISQSLQEGANTIIRKSFLERDIDIVNNSQYLICFTWGKGAKVKENSGSSYTMKKFLAEKNWQMSYHVDLNDLSVYCPALA